MIADWRLPSSFQGCEALRTAKSQGKCDLRKFVTAALAGASTFVIAGPAAAHPAPPQHSPTGDGAATALSEIVVTARRRPEGLQDAPLTVNVVTADTLQ